MECFVNDSVGTLRLLPFYYKAVRCDGIALAVAYRRSHRLGHVALRTMLAVNVEHAPVTVLITNRDS